MIVKRAVELCRQQRQAAITGLAGSLKDQPDILAILVHLLDQLVEAGLKRAENVLNEYIFE